MGLVSSSHKASMKLLIGVLAFVKFCLARPEADPQLLLPSVVPALVSTPAAVSPLLHHALPGPLPLPFPVAHPVAHVPVVKSVVEVPAQVTHQVQTLPILHQAAPITVQQDAPVSLGAAHVVKPYVNLGRKKREADAIAEADADAYYYSSVATPYASYGSFVPDYAPLPYHVAHAPLVATASVAAPVPIAAAPVAPHASPFYSHYGFSGVPYWN